MNLLKGSKQIKLQYANWPIQKELHPQAQKLYKGL